MAGAHRRKIRNLLKKGTLTGFETARIVMSQIYDLEKIAEPELFGLEGAVTPKRYKEAAVLTIEEIDALKDRNLKGHNDRIKEYNDWLGAFSSFLSLIYSAHIYYLQVQKLQSSLIDLLRGYLIIQNPSSEKSLANHRQLAFPDSSAWERISQTPKTFFTFRLLEAKHYISLFLFRKSLLKAVSDATGIDFCDQVDRWYEEMKYDLEIYENFLSKALTLSDGIRDSLSGIPDTINLDEIQISERLENKFRERISQPLESEKWVVDCMLPFHKELIEKSENGALYTE